MPNTMINKFPTFDLLLSPPISVPQVASLELAKMAELIESCLAAYDIMVHVENISPGPAYIHFDLLPAPGVKVSQVINLSHDITRSLSASTIQIVPIIPGTPYIGLNVLRNCRDTIYLRTVLDYAQFKEIDSHLAIALGKDISGNPVITTLTDMQHLLIGGATGSGKSTFIHAMILSLLYKATPIDVRFIMIDTNMLELSVYEKLPHSLTRVISNTEEAVHALHWCLNEMKWRYKLISALGVRSLIEYNQRVQQAIDLGHPIPNPFWIPSDGTDTTSSMLMQQPNIIVVIDEFSDLMLKVGKEAEALIVSLTQQAHIAGIHLVLATRYISVDIITNLIKSNIPTRIAFSVFDKTDSYIISGQNGAELLPVGDMLYVAPHLIEPLRLHGALVHEQEIHSIVQEWQKYSQPQYIKITSANDYGAPEFEDEELDSLFEQAVVFVIEKQRASISEVQRQFRIGYNRAARIIEQMETIGIISMPDSNGNRKVLVPPS
ncbi:DNA translocase FtsK [Photorhabdus bodei]|uniref:DNA translocase FtsK n=1 Tax=Photorhabdus bodei TaxID=2029681 RepID=UPI0032B746BB